MNLYERFFLYEGKQQGLAILKKGLPKDFTDDPKRLNLVKYAIKFGYDINDTDSRGNSILDTLVSTISDEYNHSKWDIEHAKEIIGTVLQYTDDVHNENVNALASIRATLKV